MEITHILQTSAAVMGLLVLMAGLYTLKKALKQYTPTQSNGKS